MEMWRNFIRAGVCVLSAGALSAQTIQVITKPHQPTSQAMGDSTVPELSADGRWLVFVSDANNLVTNDENGFNLDVFIQEVETGETRLVSHAAGGSSSGNNDSYYSGITSDGRFVLLESDASDLVEGDSNEASDVFVWDGESEEIELISKGLDGEPANGPSGYASFSPGGRFIVFESLASNLAEGDDNEAPDVFHYDRETGVISLVSRQHDGAGPASSPFPQASIGFQMPAVSADGRYVAFVSTATNLIAVMPAPSLPFPKPHLFVRDMEAQENILATDEHNFAAQFSEMIFPPQSSLLIFTGESLTPNVPASVTNVIFSFDPESRQLEKLPGPADASPRAAFAELSVSADGSRVAYTYSGQVYLWEAETGSSTRVSSAATGEPSAGFSYYPILTADGRYVFFLSTGEDLTGIPTGGIEQLYRHDIETGETRLVSQNRDGNAGNAAAPISHTISAGGEVAAWDTQDSDLVPEDRNTFYDIFIALLPEGEIHLASNGIPELSNATANGYSRLEAGALSWDGRYLVFSSLANDLVPGDENEDHDVFLHDFKTGETTRVSTGPEGEKAGGGSHSAIISGNGRFAAFISYASFSEADTNSLVDAYVKDLETGAIELASVNSDGTGPIGTDVQQIAISMDGGHLAFIAGEERFGRNPIYIRDLLENRTVEGPGTTIPEFVFSANGSLAAASAGSAILLLESETGATNLITYADSMFPLAFDDEGSRLLAVSYTSPRYPELLLFDVTDPANVPEPVLITTNGMDAALSPSGDVIAYYENLSESRQQLHLATAAGERLASLFPVDGVEATRMIYPPTFSRDARWFAFSSRSSGIFPGDTNGMGDNFLFDRGTGRLSWLSEPPGGGVPTGPSVTPIVSRDGSFVVFQSDDPNLVPNDLNAATDIFVRTIPRTDGDNDGLDDGYETLLFGGSDAAGSGDADGDGFSNAFEIAAATDPLNAESVLTASAAVTSEGPRLRWQAVPGVAYSVQYKDEITAPWEILSERIVATDGTVEISGLDDLPNQRFYRIVIAE